MRERTRALAAAIALAGAPSGALFGAVEPPSPPAQAPSPAAARRLPPLHVSSGDEKALEPSSLAGKVVVLFYEGRDAAERNRAAKDALNSHFRAQAPPVQAAVVRLAIVDASGANFLTRGVWRSKLRDASKKEDVTVWGDWDGAAGRALGAPGSDSTLLLVDASGTELWRKTGVVAPAEVEAFRTTLERAVAAALSGR